MSTPALQAVLRGAFVALSLACGTSGDLAAQRLNDFDLEGASVPADSIQVGAARDAIRALDAPRFMPAVQARTLSASTRVLGLVHGGVAKAYPLDVLTYHEIINDDFGAGPGKAAGAATPVVVTYCPLCASGVAYEAQQGGKRLVFGVSGLLHNSGLLMFDRSSKSLWMQIGGRAISGPKKGATLTSLPLVETTWADWKAQHPATLVLSRDTRSGLRYDVPLYPGYANSTEVRFAVQHKDGRMPAKDLVLGVVLGGQAKAWPLPVLRREAIARGVSTLELEQELGGESITITYDVDSRSAAARDAEGELLPGMVSYWFAWHAFQPRGGVYRQGS